MLFIDFIAIFFSLAIFVGTCATCMDTLKIKFIPNVFITAICYSVGSTLVAASYTLTLMKYFSPEHPSNILGKLLIAAITHIILSASYNETLRRTGRDNAPVDALT